MHPVSYDTRTLRLLGVFKCLPDLSIYFTLKIKGRRRREEGYEVRELHVVHVQVPYLAVQKTLEVLYLRFNIIRS